MICSKCNADIPDISKFCPACGSAVEQSGGGKFCTGCGKPLAVGTKFCADCGTPAVQSTAETAQPVMAATPSPVSAVPTPVNDVPAAPVSAVPTPVNDVPAAPVSAVPTPVNDAPAPLGSTASVGAAFAAAATMAAPANTQPPSYSVDLGKGGESAPVSDFAGMSAASAAVAAPVKKKRIGLWIGLGIGVLLIAAAAVIGLFFRGVAANVVMGDNKYAAMVEGDGIRSMSREMNAAAENEQASASMSSAVNGTMSVMNAMMSAENAYYAIGEESMTASSELTAEQMMGMLNLKEIIPAYHAVFMETYGMNSATITYDVDLELTEAGKSALGLSGEEIDEIIETINDTKLELSATAAENSLESTVALTDGTGFRIDAKGIVYSDGTVGVMFPFGSSKCVAVKLDAEGEPIRTETAEFELDEAEMNRVIEGLTEIYLSYYEKAEVKVEGGSELTAAGVTAEGRLITVKMSPELLCEMLAEMLTYIADDTYLMGKAAEFFADMEMTYSAEDIKNELLAAAAEVKSTEDMSAGFLAQTLVDNNGSVLAKAYGIYNPEADETAQEEAEAISAIDEVEREIKISFIQNDSEAAIAFSADNTEFFSAKAVRKSETDGRIRITVSEGGATFGLNIDYEGVKNEKYCNTEIPVGRYTIYMAGTEESTPDGSMFRLELESSVSGNTYDASVSGDVASYGSAAISFSCTPSDKPAPSVPGGAYIIDANDTSEEARKECYEYVLGILTDIRAVCSDNASSPFAQLIAPAVEEGIVEFENFLNPMVDSASINALIDRAYNESDSFIAEYNEYANYADNDTADEALEIYHDYQYMMAEMDTYSEMEQEVYAEFVERLNELKSEADAVVETVRKTAEYARANAADPSEVIGSYSLTDLYNMDTAISADVFGMGWDITVSGDGTFYSVEYVGEEQFVNEGTWRIDGTMLILEQELGETALNITDDALVMGNEGELRYILEKND